MPSSYSKFKFEDLEALHIKTMEEIIEDEIKPIAINPDSPMAQGLLRMLLHKQLREKFWFGEITFEELNKQLLEKGINKQYEHPAAV